MTEDVRNFIETNYELLDNGNMFEFFMYAYNSLSIPNQVALVHVLGEASIDTYDARESVIRYIITRRMEDIDRQVSLRMFVARTLHNILGFDSEWIFNYILDNVNEWDNEIELRNATYFIHPAEETL